MKSLSHVQLFVTPWTVAYQASPSTGFSRQEYWSGLLFPSSGHLPDPGIKPGSPTLQADALTSEPPGKPHFSLHLSFSRAQVKPGPHVHLYHLATTMLLPDRDLHSQDILCDDGQSLVHSTSQTRVLKMNHMGRSAQMC